MAPAAASAASTYSGGTVPVDNLLLPRRPTGDRDRVRQCERRLHGRLPVRLVAALHRRPICRDTVGADGNLIAPTAGGRIYYLDNADYNVTSVVKYISGAGRLPSITPTIPTGR